MDLVWDAPENEGGGYPRPFITMNTVGSEGVAPAVTKRLSTRCVSKRVRCRCGIRLQRVILLFAAVIAACDHGLAPPTSPQTGEVIVRVSYAGHPEAWPTSDSLQDLRFVAMRFVPTDTADFLQLNRMVYSDRLRYNVSSETAGVSDVGAGPFLYAGVAQKFGTDPFAWRPVGLVEDADGVFLVRPGETTHVDVTVDFRNPPVFPPPALSSAARWSGDRTAK